jgi:hypothetical protein
MCVGERKRAQVSMDELNGANGALSLSLSPLSLPLVFFIHPNPLSSSPLLPLAPFQPTPSPPTVLDLEVDEVHRGPGVNDRVVRPILDLLLEEALRQHLEGGAVWGALGVGIPEGEEGRK